MVHTGIEVKMIKIFRLNLIIAQASFIAVAAATLPGQAAHQQVPHIVAYIVGICFIFRASPGCMHRGRYA
jgi:hypothetical protein